MMEWTKGITKGWMAGFLAIILTIGFFSLIIALFTIEIPEKNGQLLTAAAGILFGGVGMAWGFFYADSKAASDARALQATQQLATITPLVGEEVRKQPSNF